MGLLWEKWQQTRRPFGHLLLCSCLPSELTLNTCLAFLMEELELEAVQRQTVGTGSQRRPSPHKLPHPAHQHVPLDAALAKHFWKLTALTDGVWEEGKISSSAPGPRLC